jgi:hypothetical protein
MVPITLPDQTLMRMNEAMERQYVSEQRGYIGASAIGSPCDRRIWNQFHWVDAEKMTAKSLKAIADGHHSEELMASRLRLVPGISLHTHQENGKQLGFEDGHIRGHLDGVIFGLESSPEEHVWEHKCVNVEKFEKLLKLKVKDEARALLEWDEIYFAQAQLYMHYFGIKRHYLTVCTPGSRDETSCFTAFNPAAANHYIERANKIVLADKPPPRISESASWFQCKWCPFTDNCHGEKPPAMNCRTCVHSTSTQQGTWVCELHHKELDKEVQRSGCKDHLHNPGLMAGTQTDAGEGWIEYKLNNGTTIRNQNATVTTIPATGG